MSSLSDRPWIWREALKEKNLRRLREARDLAERRARARRIVVPPGVLGMAAGEERYERDNRGNEMLFVADPRARGRQRRAKSSDPVHTRGL